MISDDRDLGLIRGWSSDVAPPTTAVRDLVRAQVIDALNQPSSKRHARRRLLLLAAIVGLLVLGAAGAFASGLLWAPGAVEPGNGVIVPEKFDQTRRLAGPELARALDIARFRWRERRIEGGTVPELLLGPHDDRRLKDCGSGKFEGSLLVLARRDEIAYCILGVDTSNPDSVFAARAIAGRLISGKPFTSAQLEKLKERVGESYPVADGQPPALAGDDG